jgi:hypothetical protein
VKSGQPVGYELNSQEVGNGLCLVGYGLNFRGAKVYNKKSHFINSPYHQQQ